MLKDDLLTFEKSVEIVKSHGIDEKVFIDAIMNNEIKTFYIDDLGNIRQIKVNNIFSDKDSIDGEFYVD